MVPAVTKDGWRLLRMHVAQNPSLHAALGLHPMFIEQHKEKHLEDLDKALSLPPVHAIGEIGLDFYEPNSQRDKQEVFFRAQLKLAMKHDLPIILHVRKAHNEVLKHLNMLNFKQGGIVHAFGGSLEIAKDYIKHGFKLGFGGTMTYPRSVKIREMVKVLPLESLVLETDAPDMLPASSKSDRNTPIHLIDIFKVFCELRDESPDVLARTTTNNAKSVFKIP
jgi:TatD DNase family protein